MFDVGGGELVLIILVILLLFGPKKIPELSRQVGKGLRHFRKAQEDLTQQIRDISAEAAEPVRTIQKDMEGIKQSFEIKSDPFSVSRDSPRNSKSNVADGANDLIGDGADELFGDDSQNASEVDTDIDSAGDTDNDSAVDTDIDSVDSTDSTDLADDFDINTDADPERFTENEGGNLSPKNES
ncbi:MAG: twin-arginine translocase TatA/TatE family subunit [Ignavibacteria bacterium]|nr:twin-arginine translocase TatA/TatE family subunit [Ignavibacteria bacterium]